MECFYLSLNKGIWRVKIRMDDSSVSEWSEEASSYMSLTTSLHGNLFSNGDEEKDVSVSLPTPSTSRQLWYYDFPVYMVAKVLFIYLGPVLMFLGTVTNILAVVVIIKSKTLRKKVASIYLIVLAVVDTAFLNLAMTDTVTWYHFKTIQTLNVNTCRAFSVFFFTLQYYEAWVIVNMNIERFVAVYFPFKVKQICSKYFACIGLGVTLILCLAVNTIYIPEMKFVNTESHGKNCIQMDGHYALKSAWLFVDFVLASALPCCIMVLCSVAIIVRVVSANRRRQTMHVTSVTKVSGMTVMTLGVAVSFFLFTAPVCIGYMIWEFKPLSDTEWITIEDTNLVIRWFWYCNYGTNFFIYCVGNPNFRTELKALFKCKSNETPKTANRPSSNKQRDTSANNKL